MKISVIFPVKNQTAKLLTNLRERALPYYDSLGVTYEFLIVSDGSDESNQKALESAITSFPMQVKLLPYMSMSGKGHNVKRGIEAATGDYVMFMDADLATDLHTLDALLPILTHYDCFVASRHMPGSEIIVDQNFIRRFIGRMSRLVIRRYFHLNKIFDTQCGYKIYRTSIAKEMARRQIISGFAFDVEYLFFLQLNGFRIKEIPVKWSNDKDSSLKNPLKISLFFMKDLHLIKKNKRNYILSNSEKAALK